MATTTTVINAQAVNLTTGVGDYCFPQKLTLQASTTRLSINVRCTSGTATSDPVTPNAKVTVYAASSTLSTTAAAAPLVLGTAADIVESRISNKPAAIAQNRSSNLQVDGGFLYIWVTVPNLTSAMGVTLTVDIYEIAFGDSSAVIPGTGALNLGKAEDAPHVSGDVGVMGLGVRQDALLIPASATGDYTYHSFNKWGGLLVAPFGTTGKTFRGVANVAAAVTATDIAILPGNASNTVHVTKVTISGIQTTAGLVDVLLIKRSTANTVGTSSAIPSVPLDASDAAAVSLGLQYTANPTPGAAVGTIDRAYIPAGPLATGITPVTYVFEFARYGKPVILSGIAQGLAVNLNGVTVTGGTFTIIYEWLEVP